MPVQDVCDAAFGSASSFECLGMGGGGGGSGASSHMVRRVGSARLVFVYGFGGFVRLTSGSRVAGTFEILSCSYLQQIIPGFDWQFLL